jgi:iron complex outermembrane recepter protein
VRASGRQYEDDLNTLPMKAYAVVDVSASRRVWWNLELFAAVENLFNVTYLVGRAGVDTIGPPLIARGGVRIRQR